MKRNKILALVLVLAMSFALIGCGSSINAEYQFVLDAASAWVKDTSDLAALSKFIGGNFIDEELNSMFSMIIEEGLADIDDLTSGFEDDLGVQPGDDIKFTVASEADLDADKIAEYQEKLDKAPEALRESAEQLSSMREMMESTLTGMSAEDLAQIDEEFQEENGATLEEYLDILTRMSDSFNALADKLDGATIDKGVKATANYNTDDGTAAEEIDFIKIGDAWASSYMIDMISELSSIA